MTTAVMSMCRKGLHSMTEENSQQYVRRHKGGEEYTATRCVACRDARRNMKPSHEWLVDARTRELKLLFGPHQTDEPWQLRAGCIGEDPDEMFPRTTFNSWRVKAITERNCSWCPVRTECLVDALVNPVSGIRGGMLLPGALLSWDETPLLEQLMRSLP